MGQPECQKNIRPASVHQENPGKPPRTLFLISTLVYFSPGTSGPYFYYLFFQAFELSISSRSLLVYDLQVLTSLYFPGSDQTSRA
jgi:hypothetical protein